MALKDYLIIFKRWLWLMILALLASVGASLFGLHALKQVPVYEATAIVAIGGRDLSLNQDVQLLSLSREIAPTYIEMATLLPVTQAVVDNLGLPYPPEQLRETLQITTIPNTPFIAIRATAPNGPLAANIANEVARQLSIQSPIRSRDFVRVVEPATLSKGESLEPYTAVLLAAFLGGFIALGFIFMFEYFNKRVRSARDLSGKLDLPIVELPQSKRSIWFRLLSRQSVVERDWLVWWRVVEICQQAWKKQPPHHLLVTGIETAGACDYVAANLVNAWAQLGQKAVVIKINSDIIIPYLKRTKESVKQVSGAGSHFNTPQSLSPSPPYDPQPNLADLNSNNGSSIDADVLIYEGQDLLSTPQSSLLARQMKGTLLVVRRGQTGKQAVLEAVETLYLLGGPALAILIC